MRTLPIFFFGLLLLGGLASCSNSVVDPATDPSVIYQANLTDIKNYAVSKGLSGSSTSSGLYYAVTKANPSAISVAYGLEVEFNYRLFALYGPSNVTGATSVTDFLLDTTYLSKSFFKSFYSGTLLPGLEEGLQKMHEGEQGIMLMPSILAFGEASATNFPANSPVRFDVKMVRVRSEDQQIDEYIATQKMTPTEVTASGVRFIKTLANPTGIVPTATQTLTIKYRGQLIRATPLLNLGTAFDSTGTGTYSSLVSQFKPGFAEGLAKLRVGEKATIIFPSKLGYQDAGVKPTGSTDYLIPPYAPLRFDIELVSAQ